MKRCLLALVCMAALSGSALAQSSPSFTYPGLEGLLYSGMTAQQQNVYNAIQVYMNYSTQVVTAAAYSSAQKKLQNGETLTAFDNTLLARGPFAITTGNQAFVPIGGTTTTTP
ncbi:hypothetical protein [Fundidesulfovibrio terrae]|uniref:hypothetical protein n=1 Tax=Fundidesulfovibrio terrae TaxID=2922866 RepID=UPI001FAF4238|nr:hypothetical protein [Fundidesulfovibrio terrae]